MDYSLGLGEILALASALTMAIASMFYGMINKKISPLAVNLLTAIPALFIYIVVLIFLGNINDIYITNLKILALIVAATMTTFVICGTLFIKSIRLAGVSVVAPITSTTPVFTMILAVIFFNEVLTPFLILGTLAVVVGVIILTIQKNVDETKRKNVRKGILYTLIIAVLWSISPILLKTILMDVGIIPLNVLRLSIHIGFLSIILASQKKLLSSFKIKTRDAVNITVAGGLGYFLTVILYLLSMELIGISRSTVLSCVFPLFAFILAVTFLKEEITRFKLIGTIITVFGVILITI